MNVIFSSNEFFRSTLTHIYTVHTKKSYLKYPSSYMTHCTKCVYLHTAWIICPDREGIRN